ncbi:MAG TPA: hypothetical protein VKR06_38040 [Ktedonosporobacter sp.]|nr:hypothetical protein [Ktedonosporobacter sp.]
MTTRGHLPSSLMLYILTLLALFLSSCDLSTFQADQNTQQTQHSTFTGSTAPITYSTGPHDLLVRTFHGGGLQGSLQFGPDVSIYGDGSYIIGLNQQGKLTTQALQQLLNTLVDTYGLLDLKRQQFADIPDQNAAFLELALNNKQVELMYGTLSSQQTNKQDMDEYQRLGKALTALIEALKGPLHPYNSTASALLVHQVFGVDYTKTILYWRLPDFTLAELARYECSDPSTDYTSPNSETGCLKYLIPTHALLLTGQQFQFLQQQVNCTQASCLQWQGIFAERGSYYTTTLRPLLPDEQNTKTLAMFGSAQSSFKGVPLSEGTVPPATPTPAT